ncbi:MAG: ATP-binding protein, partial [Caldimicrobium sp.]
KKEIEREKRKALYFYMLLSCIGVAITIYVFYLYRIQKKYRIELEEATHILEDALQERSTSLRLISQKLREEIQKLEKILTTIDWGIALIDSKGTIIKVNNAFNKIFHVRELDVLGKPITKIFENFISSESQNISNNLKLSYTKFTTKINLKDQEKFLLIAKTPIEETPYSLITIRDITLEKKWEEEITRYTQLETLRVIASGLAHDLNNLLATILNNVEILLILFGSQVSLQVKEKLEQIKKTCLRAKSLTQQLLIYGKSLILSVEEYSLISWLKEIVDLTLAGSRIEVQYIMDPDIKSIIGDKNLLGIALQNILLNSRQAMQDKGTIKIYVEKKLPFIVIAIHDSGPGIPEEIKDKLFQPFTSTKPGGSGLGLFSTKRIVEAHDGKIEVESTPGMGTLVKIYLPFREAVEKEREEKEKETFPAFHGKKVLLMDDEEDLRETLKELLEISGYVVTACERGEEAIELYQREGPFDVVILDLTVPGKYDGIQTFLELKKIDPEIKAILATGYAYKNEVVDAKSLGFFEVLLKPFSFENLIEVLEKISR